jgi:hypothetical protein
VVGSERVGLSESIGGVLLDCVYMGGARNEFEAMSRCLDSRFRDVKRDGPWKWWKCLGRYAGLGTALLVHALAVC